MSFVGPLIYIVQYKDCHKKKYEKLARAIPFILYLTTIHMSITSLSLFFQSFYHIQPYDIKNITKRKLHIVCSSNCCTGWYFYRMFVVDSKLKIKTRI